MKYIIELSDDSKIKRVGRIKPTLTQEESGNKFTYNIPEKAIIISEQEYLSIVETPDLLYNTFVDGKLIPETSVEKEQRLEKRVERDNQRKVKKELEEVKNLLLLLGDYLVLTEQGQKLLKQ